MAEGSGIAAPRPGLGMAAMLANTLMIPVMGLVIKNLAALDVGTLEMLAVRATLTLGLLLPLLLWRQYLRAVLAADLRAHLLHASLAVFTMACFYYALRTLPIVTVTAINFTTPIFALILARLMFAERVAPLGWLAMLMGFAGTLIVLRPDTSGIGTDAIVVLIGSLSAAGMNLAVRRMPARSTNYAVLFYFSVAGAVVYGAIAAPGFRPPTAEAWPLLAALAAIALAVHACTTVAYRVAASMLIGALDYSRIIWAALIGYLFLAETPDLLDGLGAVLIVVSGFIVMRMGRARPMAAEVGQGPA